MIAERILALLPHTLPAVVGDLPGTAVDIVAIQEISGPGSTEYFISDSTSSLFQPMVRIVVRNSSYATGQAWCDALKDTLHRYHDDTLLSVLLVGDPMYLGRSETKLHEFQSTYKIQVKE